jgi:DNA-binding NtrC family response regulator
MARRQGKLLIVDDNRQILDSLYLLLKTEFEQVDTLSNPNLIPSKLQSASYDIVLLDMNFSAGKNTGNEGIFWLHQVLALDPAMVVILITAYGDIELAVRSIREGATDFITKPWDTEKLIITLNNSLELRRSKLKIEVLSGKQEQLNRELDRRYPLVTGISKAFKEVIQLVEKVAHTDANVLILGENGTGKELIAHEIHRLSSRSQEVFISVDMASLSESLFESEMFGHRKGAFTDAREDRMGRFEAASGGTLFLDEIGNLSMPTQSKLLVAIQNRQITRVGSNKAVDVDIRLVCATNKTLPALVKEQLFREDLLYRINTIQIEIPPLRKRTEDIPFLAGFYLRQYAEKYNKPSLGISEPAVEKMMAYAWPGNVRELNHTIEKAVILCESSQISTADLFLNATGSAEEPESFRLSDVEKWTIEKVLAKYHGNLTQAAHILDVSRTTLYTKMKNYKL